MCVGAIISALAFPLPDPHWGADNLQAHPCLVQLVTSKNEGVPALHIKVPSARFTLLYSHGNAEDVSISIEYLEEVAQEVQADVFAYEYVGYGSSALNGDKPSEAGCYRAVEAACAILCSPSQSLHIKSSSLAVRWGQDLRFT